MVHGKSNQAQKSWTYNSIQQYMGAGFVVIPLNGKRPVVDNWVNAPYELTLDKDRFPSNFGVVLQHEDCVLDIDPRNFDESEQHGNGPLGKLLKAAGVDPEVLNFTLMVETGGGGFHFYFKKPADVSIVGSLKEYKGVEFKTKGAQVVGAGSIHPDTKRPYKFSHSAITTIAELPQGLLDLIRKDSVEVSSGIEDYKDDEATEDRYIEYLERAPLATEGNEGDKTTFTVACYGKELGLSPLAVYELMSLHYNPNCTPPWGPSELELKVKNAFRYSSQPSGSRHPEAEFDPVEEAEDIKSWDRYANGSKKPTLKNTVYTFVTPEAEELSNMLQYNEFTEDISFLRLAPWHVDDCLASSNVLWTDRDTAQYRYYVSEKLQLEPRVRDIEDAIVNVSAANTFHPVRAYLDGLKWDGVSRIDTWLTKYLGAVDSDYTRQIGAKTLIAAITRIYTPGVKFDHMLVLEGPQGIGKSQAVKALGGSWYGDITVDAHNRDTIDAMRGKWIIEISEMECTRRTETQALKAFISRETDRVRLAYARSSKDFHRQCIFIGTINPEGENDYLKDSTGNRRFWPVLLHKIDIGALKSARDQLWAEAKHRFEQGEPLYITDKKVLEQAQDEQRERTHRDPWVEKITKWVDGKEEGSSYRTVVSGAQLYEECLGGLMRSFSRREQSRISTIMQSDMGWEKGSFYDTRKQQNIAGYRRKESITDL